MTTTRYTLTLPCYAVLITCIGFAVMLRYLAEILLVIGETMKWLIGEEDNGMA